MPEKRGRSHRSVGSSSGVKRRGVKARIKKLFGLQKPPPGIPSESRFGTYLILSILLVMGLLVYAGIDYYHNLEQGHIGLAQHWHSKLRIVINGKDLVIPSSIGVKEHQEFLRGKRGGGQVTVLDSEPLHTHADDGIIHIESKIIRNYTLGDFFKVWGKTFNGTCILEYCNNSTHQIMMSVNGKPTNQFEVLQLNDGQSIVIQYERR